MQSPWWDGDYPVTQGYGCTPFLEEGSSPFHPECAAFHDGIDIALPCGTVIICQVSGYVRQVGWGGGGPYALILSAGNWDVWLGHLEASYVSPGQAIHPGLALGLSDNLGFSTGCHLHFEVTRSGGGYRDSIDPTPFLLSPDRAESGAPSPPYPVSADSSWKRSGLLDPTGVNRMTRGDIAALFRLLYMILKCQPKPVPNDPQGRYDDQFWADHWLEMVGQHGDGPGQYQAIIDWLNDFGDQPAEAPKYRRSDGLGLPLEKPAAGQVPDLSGFVKRGDSVKLD